MNIVSIQSQVVYGFAGNTAAVPVLQHLGHQVWAVPTTLLSNTPIYPTIQGGPLEADRLAALLDGLLERTGADGIDAILTGYMATAENARVTAGFIDRVKTTNSDVLYLCDPVMGDMKKGLYIPDLVAKEIIDRLVPQADILAPNLFEAAFLTEGHEIDAERMAQELAGDRLCVVKSVPRGDMIANLAASNGESWTAQSPKVDVHFTGTGDAFSAAFLGHYLRDRNAGAALQKTTALVYGLIERTHAAGAAEVDPAMLG